VLESMVSILLAIGEVHLGGLKQRVHPPIAHTRLLRSEAPLDCGLSAYLTHGNQQQGANCMLSDETDDVVVEDPGICGGEAVVRGTRIPVSMLVALKAQGAPDAELLEDYPSLTPQTLNAALRWGQQHAPLKHPANPPPWRHLPHRVLVEPSEGPFIVRTQGSGEKQGPAGDDEALGRTR
jgi:uncharacterized protein (DUF433 family)